MRLGRSLRAMVAGARGPSLAYDAKTLVHSIHLFHPVSREELRQLFESKMRAFPPRLPHQPIFYPLNHEGYARQVAADSLTQGGATGAFLTRFAIDETYAATFERRVVGERAHHELWVPAEELAEFNDHIKGPVDVIAAYFGAAYRGSSADGPVLAGLSATGQLVALAQALRHAGPEDGLGQVLQDESNREAVFLNFFFWQHGEFLIDGVDETGKLEVLAALKAAWALRHEGLHLGTMVVAP